MKKTIGVPARIAAVLRGAGIVVCMAVPLTLTAQRMEPEKPPLTNQEIVSSSYQDIKRGQLIDQWADTSGQQITNTLYKTPDGKVLMLSNDIGNMNIFFADQIDSRKAAVKFAGDTLPFMLAALFGTGRNTIITKGWVDNDAECLDRDVDDTIRKRDGLRDLLSEAETVPGRRESLIFKKHICEPEPRIIGNDWTLKLNVVTLAGSVECWKLTGKVYPLQIQTFSREILEPGGTIAVTAFWIPPLTKNRNKNYDLPGTVPFPPLPKKKK